MLECPLAVGRNSKTFVLDPTAPLSSTGSSGTDTPDRFTGLAMTCRLSGWLDLRLVLITFGVLVFTSLDVLVGGMAAHGAGEVPDGWLASST